jgi:hypothetical protein
VCGCDIVAINHTQQSNKPVLPPIVAPKDAIELEVFFVERPLGDPLFGDSLWRELDQISTVLPQSRSRLFKAGIRFGVAGNSPPASLRALAGASDATAEGPALRRQLLPLFAGQAGTLEVAVLSEPFEVVSAGVNGQAPRRYDFGRCVVRVTGEQTQDGWVRLHFLPEIHHGQEATRPVASEQEWQYQKAQSIDPFYEQQFDVELNQGEVIVLGATGDAADSVGGRFFRGLRDTTPVERLLIVRVSTIKEIAPVRANQW